MSKKATITASIVALAIIAIAVVIMRIRNYNLGVDSLQDVYTRLTLLAVGLVIFSIGAYFHYRRKD